MIYIKIKKGGRYVKNELLRKPPQNLKNYVIRLTNFTTK